MKMIFTANQYQKKKVATGRLTRNYISKIGKNSTENKT